MKLRALPWSFFSWFAILAYCLYAMTLVNWKNERWTVFNGDEIGYYAYLPSTWIYHDYQFNYLKNVAVKYRLPDRYGGCSFCTLSENKPVDKFFAGESVLLTPFFLAGHLMSGSESHPRDGFSFYYVAAVTIGTLFYLLLGLWAIRGLLKRFGMDEWVIALVLLFLFFGSNLSHYTLNEPLMTHVYSFSLVAVFLLLAHKEMSSHSRRRLLQIAVVLALIVLVRPINALIVFVLPFLAGDRKTFLQFWRNIFSDKTGVLLSILVGGILILIQPLYYKLETGRWWIYAYDQEGFNFSNPHLFKFLFSYSNGFFVYAPVIFIGALGLFAFWRKEKFRFVSFLFFLLVVDWVLSSWWAWTYGGAFGMRPMIEYLPVFAILFAAFLQAIGRNKMVALAVIFLLLFPLTALTQFQVWQYQNAYLAWDNMTGGMYWNVFLKTDKKYQFLYTDLPGAKIPSDAKLVYSYFSDLEKPDTVIKNWETVIETDAFSGKHAGYFINSNSNPPFWGAHVREVLKKEDYEGKTVWLRTRQKIRLDKEMPDANMFFAQIRNDSFPFIFSLRLASEIYKAHQWKDFEYTVQLEPLRPDDIIRVLPTKNDSSGFFIDDVEIKIYSR